jgi:hypothetical protein
MALSPPYYSSPYQARRAHENTYFQNKANEFRENTTLLEKQSKRKAPKKFGASLMNHE